MRSCLIWGNDSLWNCVQVEALIVYKIMSDLRHWYFMRSCLSWDIDTIWDRVQVEALIVQSSEIVSELRHWQFLAKKDRVRFDIDSKVRLSNTWIDTGLRNPYRVRHLLQFFPLFLHPPPGSPSALSFRFIKLHLTFFHSLPISPFLL